MGCSSKKIQLPTSQLPTITSQPFHPNSTQRLVSTLTPGEISATHPTSTQLLISTPTPVKISGTNSPTLSTSPTRKPLKTPQGRGTRTPTELFTKTQVSDYYLTNTAVVQVLLTTVTPQDYQQLLSPNQQYLADFIVLECTNIIEGSNPFSLRTLKITDKMQPNTWIVTDRLIYCGGEGSGGILGGLFWSNNSRYFYYTDNWYGETNTNPTAWINLAYRYDLSSKEILSLSGLALSLDKLKIAAGDGSDLVVWDLDGGEIARFPGNDILFDQLSTIWLHYLAWSSDSSSIAYILTKQSPTNESSTSYILIANVSQKQNSLLFESTNPEFIEVHWIDQSHLSLLGNDHQLYSNWEYSITDNSLTPIVTDTPVP